MGFFAENPSLILLLDAFLCYGLILIMLRFLGKSGLYLYIIVAVIMANIQVLKLVEFSFYHAPIPLGTILFTSTYLCTDILLEYFDKDAAKKGIILGFSGFALWVIFSFVTRLYPLQPLNEEAHGAMEVLLAPSAKLFIAGMGAFAMSQLMDIYVFDWIRKKTEGRYLWMRNTGSTLAATLFDNIMFSLLAWVILAEDPVSWTALLFTYILGTYWMRALLAIFDTPFIYFARYFLPAIPLHKKI